MPEAKAKLALCCHVGFGVKSNASARESLLEDQGTKRSFQRLCHKTRHCDKTSGHPVFFWNIGSGYLKGAQFLRGVITQDLAETIPPALHEVAIRTYRDEIEGKEASGVGLRSLTELLTILGNIYTAMGLAAEAAKCYDKGIKNENKYIPRRAWFSMFATTPHRDCNFLAAKLAEALTAQNKAVEAIRTLSGIKTIFKNPNGKYSTSSLIWTGSTAHDRREIVARHFLATLLIRQGGASLKRVVKLDLVNDLCDLIELQGIRSREVKQCEHNISELGNALCSAGLTVEALVFISKVSARSK